eukprot:UN24997
MRIIAIKLNAYEPSFCFKCFLQVIAKVLHLAFSYGIFNVHNHLAHFPRASKNSFCERGTNTCSLIWTNTFFLSDGWIQNKIAFLPVKPCCLKTKQIIASTMARSETNFSANYPHTNYAEYPIHKTPNYSHTLGDF